MWTDRNPQTYRAEKPKRVGSGPRQSSTDRPPHVPQRKPGYFSVESVTGMKGIREAYQTATDTWVGAD
jgi:hypothetical protein